MPENKDIELHSVEVQEIMDRIPPAIQRWGLTVITLIVAVFLAIAFYVEIPITEEFPFTMTWEENRLSPRIVISVPPATIESVLDSDEKVVLRSVSLSKEFDDVIYCYITGVDRMVSPEGNYQVYASLPPRVSNLLINYRSEIKGSVCIIISRKTIVQSIFDQYISRDTF